MAHLAELAALLDKCRSEGRARSDIAGILDEIFRRVLLSGGRVLAVRAEDMPGGAQIAGIFRYAP